MKFMNYEQAMKLLLCAIDPHPGSHPELREAIGIVTGALPSTDHPLSKGLLSAQQTEQQHDIEQLEVIRKAEEDEPPVVLDE